MTIQQLHRERYHTLQTERFLLRPLALTDAKEMFAYTSREESFRFLRGTAHTSLDQTTAFLQKAVRSYADHSDFLWGICERSTGRLIGTCRLFAIDLSDRGSEVSYLVHPDCQGQGVASEAVSRVIRYAFEELDLVRVQAHCVVDNFGSERVMQKCGMRQEGVLRKLACIHGTLLDYKIYAVIKETI